MIEMIRQLRRDNVAVVVVIWEPDRSAARCYHYHRGGPATRTGRAPWWAGAVVDHCLRNNWAVLEIYL